MSREESTSPLIRKFDGENFRTWKLQVTAMLRFRELWRIVSGQETLEQCDNDRQKMDAWHVKNEKALGCITLYLDESQLVNVETTVTAKEAWDNLCSVYDKTDTAELLRIKEKFYGTKMAEGGNLLQHLDLMKQLYSKLATLDSNITEKELSMVAVISLPPSYHTIRTVLENEKDPKWIWEEVKVKLLHEYDKIRAYGIKQADSALISKGCSPSTRRKPRRRGNGKQNSFYKGLCFSCGKPGHFAARCRMANSQRKRDTDSAQVLENIGQDFAFAMGGNTSEWLLDSAATQHMTFDSTRILNYRQFNPPKTIRMGNNHVVYAEGCGTVIVHWRRGGRKSRVSLSNVWYVPNLARNLISIAQMTSKGASFDFDKDTCICKSNGNVVFAAKLEGNLYRLHNEDDSVNLCEEEQAMKSSIDLWHLRLGHLGYANVEKIRNLQLATGMNCDKNNLNIKDCEGCAQGKLHKLPFQKESFRRATKILELVHTDVGGPMNTVSVGGSKYYITFTDDKTRYVWIYFMKTKDEVFTIFRKFLAYVETATGSKLKKLRCDRGTEYLNAPFEKFLEERGIKRELTISYTPQQNGVAERLNRTLVESARSMLHHAKLPYDLWAEAVATAAYLHNRSPTSTLDSSTPYECWHGKKPDLSHLRVFGCNAFVHVPKEKRTKFDSKSVTVIFVGYSPVSKGYRFYNKSNGKVFSARDAKFVEYSFGDNVPRSEGWASQHQKALMDSEEPKTSSVKDIGGLQTEIDGNSKELTVQDGVVTNEPTKVIRRSTRVTAKPDWYGDVVDDIDISDEIQMAGIACIAAGDIDEPRDIEEAWNGKYGSQWKTATDSEYESLLKNDTWELVEPSNAANIVGSRWVFKVKCKADGSIDRFKARLVAQGYSQKEGIDFKEVFAPVAKYTSIRTFLAVSNYLDFEIDQMDVKTAFLNGELDFEIYMKQPPGYKSKEFPNHVCKMKKSLYGLKQAARCWHLTMSTFLQELDYTQSNADPCIYVKHVNNSGKKSTLMLSLYVDDLLIASDSRKLLDLEKLALKKRFEMSDEGKVHYCLGMSINRDRKSRILTISQKRHLEGILQRFGMDDCKPIGSPQDPNHKYLETSDEDEMFDVTKFQAAIGSLTYVMCGTRPDLCSAVGALSKFAAKPSIQHWKGIKRILRYIKGTIDHGLKFDCSDVQLPKLIGYSDADWAGCLVSRRSTSGYAFKFAGSLISWRSKRQSVVAQSSTEAEYIALSSAAQELVWLRCLLADLDCAQMEPTVLFEDNQSAIALTKNQCHHERTKHIDIKFHYMRQVINHGQCEVVYCSTQEMLADFLTKGLPKAKFDFCLDKLGIINIK